MKFLFSILLVLAFANTHGQLFNDTIYVSNKEGLLNSLTSNRVIIIDVDSINLNKDIIEINNLNNLKIIGQSNSMTSLSTENYNEDVITILKSKNIYIHNLSIGHYPSYSTCTGNVIATSNSDSIIIENSDLYGCGVIGIYSYKSNVWCNSTTIRECSEDILGITHGSITLENCNFYLNKNNTLNYPKPRFEACNFYTYDSTLITKEYSGYYPVEPNVIHSDLIENCPIWDSCMNESSVLDWSCPKTISIKTSSTLKSKSGKKYSSQNLTSDLNFGHEIFTWIEGSKGNGIGETITVKVNSITASYEDYEIYNEFFIVNGYAKNNKTWTENNRIKTLKVLRNSKEIAVITLKDSPNLQGFKLDTLMKNRLAVGEKLIFEILEVYDGSKYNDTALTFLSPHCSP